MYYSLAIALWANDYGPNLLLAGRFEDVLPTYVPWAGVDDKGNIHGLDGSQIAVGEDGNIGFHRFGASIAVGDLNGDGKPDLVLADSKGFFWFFPNVGTPTQPAFTQGEVMPIWLGERRLAGNNEGVDNLVPRIQLVDFEGTKRLDILAGTYMGKLFRIRNAGSPSTLSFKPTYDRDSMLINTHKNGVLWCNYLAPCLTRMFNASGIFDLVLGEGTYSANSIYLLRNTSTGSNPAFSEDHLQKIIEGTGLEQLTPAVVDWNNDGKPDLICGDRTGHLNVYLNNSTDPDHPTFQPGIPLTIGGVDKFGSSVTVAIGDLTGNHLPNLLIGLDDGTILYARNSGQLGAPAFSGSPTLLKGVLPKEYHYLAPTHWFKNGAWGAPYELISCVTPQTEPGFTFPENEDSKYALKFSVWPVANRNFSERYYPQDEDFWNEHSIECRDWFDLKLNTRYRVHFWAKADGDVSDLSYRVIAGAPPPTAEKFRGYDVMNPVRVGSTWTETTSELEIENPDDPSVTTWRYGFDFRFTGQTTLYIENVSIQEELN